VPRPARGRAEQDGVGNPRIGFEDLADGVDHSASLPAHPEQQAHAVISGLPGTVSIPLRCD
jgi:hypothetical protein